MPVGLLEAGKVLKAVKKGELRPTAMRRPIRRHGCLRAGQRQDQMLKAQRPNSRGMRLKFAYLIEPPFNYRDGDSRVTGCDIELVRVVFERLGVNEFERVETEFANLLPGLVDGARQMTPASSQPPSGDRWRRSAGRSGRWRTGCGCKEIRAG